VSPRSPSYINRSDWRVWGNWRRRGARFQQPSFVILNYATFVGEELTSAGATTEDNQWALALSDVQQIHLAAERASELTHQLLAFARREVVQPRELSLNDAITGLELILRRTIGEQIDLVIDLSDNDAMVLADPGQIDQVVLNLAINARHAMSPGGALRFRQRCELLRAMRRLFLASRSDRTCAFG